MKGALRAEGVRAGVRAVCGSVLVEGPEPVGIAAILDHIPGVDWIAVGRSSNSVRGLASEVGRLARAYLGRGGSFAVRTESESADVKPSDIAAAGVAAVLLAVRGARVNEESPSTVFRVVFDGERGVAATELRRGPGGTPTGRRAVRCLVSGGMHSSVLAWTAMLSGFRVELVHAKVSDESLRAVARLYAELSHRVDPGKVSLVVLEGGGVRRMLAAHVRRHATPAFAGFHAECSVSDSVIASSVRSPLYLLPEREFKTIFAELGTKSLDSREAWRDGGSDAKRVSRFAGVRGDVHAVLDGLRTRTPR